MLTIMDPVCRYGEHKGVKAFEEAEVFYYQGTDFIAEVEELLVAELRQFMDCSVVETRPISGQMANTAVFSALVDYINRADRKSEQRRIRKVFNNHIIRGGHLSAQPMGALRDFVARDPKTEKPAVVNFPVHEENPYKIDVAACGELLEQHRPELIIFGKSMVLHKEPVQEIRATVDQLGLDSVVLYDMAHVLGLIGPHFQEPFKEGAHLVTGSTHKTYFGPQRGIVAGNYQKSDPDYELWEAIERRAFPGSTSNHHLGTQLGLLMAAYEMNAFKDAYQQKVIANAKAFALALKDCGLDVAGDPGIDYTETHQVVVRVGYARGAEIARRLEDNNIILNYQAAPDEEGFTASGALRMGVSEMTRFGMEAGDFQQLAQLMADVIIHHKSLQQDVAKFRKRFGTLRYCFDHDQIETYLQEIQQLLLS
jgi:aminomethyltransferase